MGQLSVSLIIKDPYHHLSSCFIGVSGEDYTRRSILTGSVKCTSPLLGIDSRLNDGNTLQLVINIFFHINCHLDIVGFS